MLNLLIRSLSTLVIGILLLMFREQALPFIVMCVGVCFILPALFILALTFVPSLKRFGASKTNAVVMPTIAVGSLLLGLWMFFSPGFFVAILMFVLGGAMTFMGIMQMVSLFMARVSLSPLLFIMPAIISVSGITILLYPFETASVPFVILGIAAIVSAVSDLINTIFIGYLQKKKQKNTEIQIIEENN